MRDAFLLKARELAARFPLLLRVRTLNASKRPTKAKLDRKVKYFETVSSTSSDMTTSL
jgi:hypothetical protein